MLGIPSRNSHFVFGTIQAGLTSLIAAGIKELDCVAVTRPRRKPLRSVYRRHLASNWGALRDADRQRLYLHELLRCR
jgi:hypothetical protein